VSPYSIVGLSATWDVNKNLSLTSGVDNLFDIRHYRAGNAQTTGNSTTGAYLYGAGRRPIMNRVGRFMSA
jgi:ferric enterobactin receptor